MNAKSEEIANNIYKNAHIALQSISNVLDECDSQKMKDELMLEYDGYEKFIGEISAYLKDNGVQPKDVGAMQKAMMWTSIKVKTMADDSCSHIADMMLKGTITGIVELLQILSRSGDDVDQTVLSYAEKLKDLEESYEVNLKGLI